MLPALLFFALSSQATTVLAEQYKPWILVDTQLNKVAVMQGLKAVKTFSGIAIGRGGASRDRRNGDQTTPIGEFSIAWISDSEKYHKFLGISYPGLEQARRALDENRISTKNFNRIKKALDEGKLPPQDTELGGNLGIHGLGNSDRAIHDSFNWTNGCIALTDEQLDELSQSVQLGTTVIIR
ncbi:MAG: L,D-transpeptidase [Gammaproteobacteria bacterium]|nr:L,D-transpeptidase [Gammaproteobacteria bacterium]